MCGSCCSTLNKETCFTEAWLCQHSVNQIIDCLSQTPSLFCTLRSPVTPFTSGSREGKMKTTTKPGWDCAGSNNHWAKIIGGCKGSLVRVINNRTDWPFCWMVLCVDTWIDGWHFDNTKLIVRVLFQAYANVILNSKGERKIPKNVRREKKRRKWCTVAAVFNHFSFLCPSISVALKQIHQTSFNAESLQIKPLIISD